MKKISSLTATATSDGLFTNGSVASGVSPTILDAGWFNTIQKELVAIVQGAGLTLDDADDAQVLAALKNLCLSRANPFGDIAKDGKEAIKMALNNLGLGLGSAVPVGVPVPWPTATPPEGWLKCNGAAFSATTYPELAKVYPGLKLLDLRGEFIRGWDDGRGADAGRGLGTTQGDAMRNLTGQVMGSNFYAFRGASSGVFFNLALDPGTVLAPQSGVPAQQGMTSVMDASRQVPTASEFRPRNVALNYIVRAA